jgi:enoyl-CoA hydratase
MTQDSGKVRCTVEAGVMTATICRPARHNCVDAETALLLRRAYQQFVDEDDRCVMVLTGQGTDAFCSGADLDDVENLIKRGDAMRDGPMGFTRLASPKPTIAAVEGYCSAGGLELACWCDFRIASSSAQFGVLNRRWGVPLIDGGTQRLPRIVGQGNALYLIITGALVDAQTALRMGLVQEVVDEGQALSRALTIAHAVAAFPRQGMLGDRQATLEAWAEPLERGLELEQRCHQRSLTDKEMMAALCGFAAGKRPAPLRPR